MSSRGAMGVELPGLVEALGHVPAAVGVVDASGKTVYTNERATELAERQLGGAGA